MTKGRERGQEDTRSHFRKGIVGDWVNHFDIAAWRACDEIAGTLLEQLGYDRQWKPPSQAVALPRLSVKQTVRATAVQAKNVTPDSAYEKALQLMRRGRPQEAITAFEKLLKDQPRHASGWRLLGQVLKDQGRLQEAIDAYLQSLALQNDVPTRNAWSSPCTPPAGRTKRSSKACATWNTRMRRPCAAFPPRPSRSCN